MSAKHHILSIILLSILQFSANAETNSNLSTHLILHKPSEYNLHRSEFLIDSNITMIPAIGGQSIPSVVYDGNNYFMVWEDDRLGSAGIFGARVTSNGAVIDSAGIFISLNASNPWSPSIAFDGTNFLVVWQELRNYYWDIYGARISTNGTVLDQDGIAISTATNDQARPTITFDGSNYLVAWHDRRSGVYDIYGTRVSTSGVVLDTGGIAISTRTEFQYTPDIAFDGLNYLVVWHEYEPSTAYDIYGVRIAQDGTIIDTVPIAICVDSFSQGDVSVTFNGTNYFAVWQDGRSGDYADIYGSRINTTGIIIDTVSIPICTADYEQSGPSVLFDGLNFLVNWNDRRNFATSDIYGARVDTSGVVLDSIGFPISTADNDQGGSVAAFDGTYFLVVWGDNRSGFNGDIYGTLVNQNGVVLDTNGFLLTTSAYSCRSPSVSCGDSNYLVTYSSDLNGTYDIYGVRITPTGIVIDSNPVPISVEVNNQTRPDIIYGDSNYFVIWQDNRSNDLDIFGTRITGAGLVIDTLGIIISDAPHNQHSPSIAFDGTQFFIAWGDERSGFPYPQIYGARVDLSGVLLDTNGITISMAPHWQDEPAIAFDGTNFLVIWHNYHNNYDIYGARVTPSGVVLDPSRIPISLTTGDQKYPQIDFDGTYHFAVWQDYRNGNWDIYGARIHPDGFVIDTTGIQLCTDFSNQVYPSIVFDGINYIVVWQDRRNGIYWDIYGIKIDPSGTVLDSFVVSNQMGHQFYPSLSHGSNNNVLTAYEGWIDSINALPVNTMRIWGEFYPFVGIAEDGRFMVKNSQYNLHVYPNPFTHNIKISFSVGHNAKGIKQRVEGTELKIYDATGRLIKSFSHVTNQIFDQVVWDGRDDAGKKLPSGVYFLIFQAGDYSATEKLLLIR